MHLAAAQCTTLVDGAAAALISRQLPHPTPHLQRQQLLCHHAEHLHPDAILNVLPPAFSSST
jgi:hypothetical protein